MVGAGRAFLFAVAGVLVLTTPVVPRDGPAATEIRDRIEQLRTDGFVRIGDATVSASRVLPKFYERRGFRRAWTNPQAVADLVAAVERIDEDGLDPQDYHLAELRRQRAKAAARTAADEKAAADFDVLLSDSLTSLAFHLLFGKVDPVELDPNWNVDRDIGDADPADVLQRLIDSRQVAREIDRLRPRDEVYGRLRDALARYRAIRERGGWPAIAEGPSLRAGMRDVRVPDLRRRLMITGDAAGTSSEERLYDNELQRAVLRFQRRHRLNTDGVVGPKTLAAMNVPVEQRIDQLRINLERARWVLQEDLTDFLVVDIAGFELFLFRNDERVWRTRVQVGRPYRQTPVFRSAVNRLIINPTWTVPPGILRKDILPAVQRDPGYLQRRRIEVIDSRGRVVDANSIDWARMSARSFPYQLRQKAGPDNALGRIKFDFPNAHLVYLHDTPSRDLFERSERAFSSGCIRIQNPLDLAQRLLESDDRWSRAALEHAIESGRTQIVRLREPFVLLLLYWTVAVDEDGTVNFKGDIYRRDAAVLSKLNSHFEHRKP